MARTTRTYFLVTCKRCLVAPTASWDLAGDAAQSGKCELFMEKMIDWVIDPYS